LRLHIADLSLHDVGCRNCALGLGLPI